MIIWEVIAFVFEVKNSPGAQQLLALRNYDASFGTQRIRAMDPPKIPMTPWLKWNLPCFVCRSSWSRDIGKQHRMTPLFADQHLAQ